MPPRAAARPTIEPRPYGRRDATVTDGWSVRWREHQGRRRRKTFALFEEAALFRAQLALNGPATEDADGEPTALAAFSPVWLADARSCNWKSSSFAKCRPGSKLRSMKPCRRSTQPFACGSRGSQRYQPTLSTPQKAANSAVARPPPACSPDWRSHTSVLGSAPSDHRQRRIPEQEIRRLGGEDKRAGAGARVAQTRDQDPRAARLAVPGGPRRPALHRSNWQISPGR
jgi:hypothetical protein